MIFKVFFIYFTMKIQFAPKIKIATGLPSFKRYAMYVGVRTRPGFEVRVRAPDITWLREQPIGKRERERERERCRVYEVSTRASCFPARGKTKRRGRARGELRRAPIPNWPRIRRRCSF